LINKLGIPKLLQLTGLNSEMPKNAKAQEKLENIIISLRDGLSEFASLIEDINKSSSMLLKLFSKTQKELKSIKLGKHSVASAPATAAAVPRVGIKSGQNAREKAANLLFNMLSGGPGEGGSVPTAAASAPPSGPSSRSGPPSAPKSGPPGRPPSAPPSAPAKSPSGLPPPPKLPPKAPGAGPPGVKANPSFMKAPPGMSPPPSKPPAAPMASGSAPAAPVAAGGGAGLSSLRDEMLKELDRLKKIMRGG
jgi:hypothetical protein